MRRVTKKQVEQLACIASKVIGRKIIPSNAGRRKYVFSYGNDSRPIQGCGLPSSLSKEEAMIFLSGLIHGILLTHLR
jgi:hypothetical protein